MIRTKRNSLEQFIRAQMEGPGACNKRFSYKYEDQKDSEDVDVINTTPGSVYSTAVLFPQRTEAKYIEYQQNIQEEDLSGTSGSIDCDNSPNETDNDVDVDEKRPVLSQAEEDDLYSLSQRFPTTMGISCCLDSHNRQILNSDLIITISGRYYTKISKDNYTKVLIRIQEDQALFEAFFNEYKASLVAYFTLNSEGLSLSHDITKNYSVVKNLLLQINKSICEKLATAQNGTLDPIYLSIGSNYRYLKSYKERLWAKLRQLQNGKYISEEEKAKIIERIKKIERNETFISYLEDAANICDAKSFGFWISQNFSKTIDLSGINLNTSERKTIFSPKRYNGLKKIISFRIDENTQASLSVWLQVTKSHFTDPSKHYLKIQLENTSTAFEEDNNHYFSIVTEKVNQRCFFGVEIKIESDLLCPYRSQYSTPDLSNDTDQLNYLYRTIHDYGIGHLCSVDWHISSDKKYVRSEFIPTYETPDVEPIPRSKTEYIQETTRLIPKPLLSNLKALEFKWLSTFSDASNEEVIIQLYDFVNTYRQWIEDLKTKTKNESPENKPFADQNIAQCESDFKRMVSNIKLLSEGQPTNIDSFRLMNSAMFIQLWHSKNSTKERTSHEFYCNASDSIFGNFPATWRPFQLAFILLNLDGIIQHPDDKLWHFRNELVDLVWFPTGGGKTEAYLGIIAVTIINRRRTKGQEGGGTTAIMRYTLRLLATQQFQRATRVILALEQIRRWDKFNLGSEPISIGLFVGEGSLPNKAEKLLSECLKWNKFINNKRGESQIPLDRCPWCEELLEYQNHGTKTSPDIKFKCRNIHCTFSDQLPVMLCDEYIYSTPPTLLFGTVDKFASLGHKVSTDPKKINQDSRRLFGKGTLNYLPPALIIQDELHLLLGPLGSAVSLFECAIDQLCSIKTTLADGRELTIRPKIISSTATTRNTKLQIRALYDREVNIFPKSGIDYDDSFFAFYKREKRGNNVHFISKRKYIGILPTGRTQMTTQMRLIATMFVHRALFEKDHADRLANKDVEKTMDFYHSIIAYFNSLKEVGKTDAQFYTEFTKYTRRLFKRVLRNSNMLECLYGYDSSFRKSELTGRLSGSEIVRQLEEVNTKWVANKRLPYLDMHSEEWLYGTTPPDLILATNMISVGLDVDRFNTIVMNSMPRNIAEYIQASSRVARNDLGLVITLHNPFRARDLSHFERFKEFHEKLYYYVEPISITPFSKKSVERYLPLYLATMIRHKFSDLANATDAGHLNETLCDQIQQELLQYFKNRLKKTSELEEEIRGLLTEELERNIESFTMDSLKKWLRLAERQDTDNFALRYSGSEYINNNSRVPTLIKYKDLFLALDAYQDNENENMWAVPVSLRTVESEAVINVKETDNGN